MCGNCRGRFLLAGASGAAVELTREPRGLCGLGGGEVLHCASPLSFCSRRGPAGQRERLGAGGSAGVCARGLARPLGLRRVRNIKTSQ